MPATEAIAPTPETRAGIEVADDGEREEPQGGPHTEYGEESGTSSRSVTLSEACRVVNQIEGAEPRSFGRRQQGTARTDPRTRPQPPAYRAWNG